MGMACEAFDRHIANFTGAAKRLEVAFEDEANQFVAFRDFAHAPSKLKATQASVVGQYPDRGVTAAFELHTFSSLNKAFVPQYKHGLDAVDHAIVLRSRRGGAQAVASVGCRLCSVVLRKGRSEVIVSAEDLERRLMEVPMNHVLLLMSSGWFGGITLP